ncbi:MAG: AMP-binding protein [Thermaerobacter sp.]|nr:AMP-binding protein [Thermaerobacter sp.]
MPSPSYVHGASDQPLLGQTIGELFDKTVLRFGDREALVDRTKNVRLTYRALGDQAAALARGLLELGVASGERVGIWSPNRWEWVVTQFGTAKIGAILVNINPAYRLRELSYALQQSGIRTLIMAPAFGRSDYLAMLRDLLPSLAECHVQTPDFPDLKEVVVLGDDAPEGTMRWQNLLALADRVPDLELQARQREVQFDDPVNIQYTSGTTGMPKGATLSHHNLLNNGYFIGELMHFSERDRLCIPVPFYHTFGMVLANLACVTHGATMVIPGEGFDAEQVLATVEAERCTALHGVPTMFIAELQHPAFGNYDLSSLRTGLMAGSPCPVEVMRQVQSRMHMAEVEIAYGMTETSPVSTQTRSDDPLDLRVSTVGKVHPHVEIKIVDPATGAVVQRGEPGELVTRSYAVMLGYWNNPAATSQAIDGARWMHTGDLAVMREDGYVNIVGRIKDMIIRGGENIYPREIEEFYYTHPKVADIQVIGVPDSKYGEQVMACIRLKNGQAATEEEMREFARGQIAHYKVPHYVTFVEAFPMTVTGKVQKYLMREMAVKELGLEGAAGTTTA